MIPMMGLTDKLLRVRVDWHITLRAWPLPVNLITRGDACKAVNKDIEELIKNYWFILELGPLSIRLLYMGEEREKKEDGT